jgi:RNA polymerase sigma-70 factor, ECF subfamily
MGIDVADYYKRYGPMVLRRCRFLLKDEETAVDAMQEVFVRLLHNQERLKGNYPSSLLFTIATNTCLNIIRSAKHNATINCDEVLLNIAARDETEERFIIGDLLDFIFQKEHRSTREIAVLHFIDGFTLEEVALEVGLSVSGVRKRLRNLRTKVRQLKEI